MIYEFRIYETAPGHMPALHEEFANITMRLFEKNGIKNIGYWTEEVGASNRLDYLVAFENLGERQKAWDSFRQDPEWLQVVKKAQEAGRPVLNRITNTILRPTPYSPKEPKGGDGMVYELRIYETLPGHLPALHDRFANVTTRLFEKHGIRNIGYWTEEIGVSNRLDYIVAYESLGAREKAWESFRQDPEWREAVRRTQEASRPVLNRFLNTILRPTPYSPLR